MKQISFTSRGHTVYGWAHVPENAQKAPAIVMCHGFCGNAAENARLFVRFANMAVKKGYYVIRFDCLGSGNSDLDFAEYTYISGWVEDMENAVRFAHAQHEIDPKRIGVLGLSMGGVTAALVGAKPEVGAVALWSPALDAENVFRGITGEADWRRLLSGDFLLESQFLGCQYAIESRFAFDAASLRIFDTFYEYGSKPTFLLQGTDDEIVSPESNLRLKDEYPLELEYHLIDGEDHDLTKYPKEDCMLTLAFFDRVFMA